MDFEEVRQKLKAALKKLRVKDSFLIKADTNERTISHKLAEYLQEEFPNWNVDCEYNRHGYDIKKLRVTHMPKGNVELNETEAKTIFPDIVVHERNNDERNLLVIEVKKTSNTESRQFDREKIIGLTKDEYRYRYGLLLEIAVDKSRDVLEWYENGKLSTD